MSYTEIKTRLQQPTFVAPVNDRQLGWLAFADGQSIDKVKDNDDMRRGWLQALRDSANAENGTVFA